MPWDSATDFHVERTAPRRAAPPVSPQIPQLTPVHVPSCLHAAATQYWSKGWPSGGGESDLAAIPCPVLSPAVIVVDLMLQAPAEVSGDPQGHADGTWMLVASPVNDTVAVNQSAPTAPKGVPR